VVFNTVGKFAKLSDVTRVLGENMEELLFIINRIVDDEECKYQ
jgi:hypothetical protein